MTLTGPVSKHENEKPKPKEKRKQDHETEMRSSLEDSNSHMHSRGPSIAACIALTTYHNIPTDCVSSRDGGMNEGLCQTLTKILNFCHKSSSKRKVQP